MHQFHDKHIVGNGANITLRKLSRSVGRQPLLIGLPMKKIREPQLVIIRNKFTKEVIDLEVIFFSFFSSRVHSTEYHMYQLLLLEVVVLLVIIDIH